MRFYDDEDIDDDEKEKEAEARQQMEEEEEEYNESRRTERVEVEEPDEDAEEEEQQGGNGRRRHKKKKEDNEDDNDKSDSNSKNESGKDKEQSGKADSKAESKSKSKKESDYEDQTKSGKKEQSSAESTRRQPKDKPQNKPNDKANNKPKPDKSKAGKSGDAAKKGAKQGTQSAQTASNASNASKAANASKTAANAGKATKSTGLIAKIGTVGLVVLIVFLVLGLLFFFITMPGLVVGKITNAINKFTDGIKNFLDGNAVERSVTRGEIVKAANYLESMGYDLQGYGFLDEEGKATASGVAKDGFVAKLHTFFLDNGSGKNAISPTQINISDFDKQNYKERYKEAVKNGDENAKNIKEVTLAKDIYEYDATGEPILDEILDLDSDSDVRSNMLMIKNLDGEVEFIKSKYLYMYIMAANNSYFVKNDNLDLGSRIKTLYDNSGLQENEGAGMIYFTDDDGKLIKDYIEGWPGDSKYGYSNTFADPEIFRNS